MDSTQTLGALLAGQNISRVAREVGKTRPAIYRWINEEAVPSVGDLPKLAAILNMDLAELTPIVVAAAQRIAKRRKAA